MPTPSKNSPVITLDELSGGRWSGEMTDGRRPDGSYRPEYGPVPRELEYVYHQLPSRSRRSPWPLHHGDYPWRLPEQRFRRRPFERFSSWHPLQPYTLFQTHHVHFGSGSGATLNPRQRREDTGLTDEEFRPYTLFQTHHVHDGSGSGATLNPRQRREDTGLTDEEFREAMDQLRKQEYRPPDVQKKQGGSGGRGILQTRSATPPATTEEKACTICLETFLPGEQVAITPCNHMFHQGCIAPWVKGHGNCPVCRFALCERSAADAIHEDGGMDLELLAMVRAMEEAFSRFRLSDSTPHYHWTNQHQALNLFSL